MKQLTHGSLFDGFGGLRRGLEDAGFQTKWARDLIYGHDIETDDPTDLERVDLISGGPPCQRGSAGAKMSSSQTYFTLWPAMLRVVACLLPHWVLVENVPGFQREMVDWTTDLYKLGYGCAGQIIDSRHWVPQQRTRCFIVGRLEADGMALWNQLYAGEIGVQAGERKPRQAGITFFGSCSDCLRDGIFARLSSRRIALMGAGNAVSQPVATWIGRRIIEATTRQLGRDPEGSNQEPQG